MLQPRNQLIVFVLCLFMQLKDLFRVMFEGTLEPDVVHAVVDSFDDEALDATIMIDSLISLTSHDADDDDEYEEEEEEASTTKKGGKNKQKFTKVTASTSSEALPLLLLCPNSCSDLLC